MARRSSSASLRAGRSTADGTAAFHGALAAQYLARWEGLFAALASPVRHCALLNAFADTHDIDDAFLEPAPLLRAGRVAVHALDVAGSSGCAPPPTCPYTGLRQWYWCDLASILPPLLLDVSPHQRVLDMCAAPGGKSLVLAMQLLQGGRPHFEQQQQQQQLPPSSHEAQPANDDIVGGLSADLLQRLELQGGAVTAGGQDGSSGAASAGQDAGSAGHDADAEAADVSCITHTTPPNSVRRQDDGLLVCNELDAARRSRLAAMLSQHIPGALRRRVRVDGHDAAQHWAVYEAGLYDRVLVDAPCSSERHVVAAATAAGGVVAASSWSMERCAQLAALQLRLLLAGLRALVPVGGRLVYSTCSMAAQENDGVVAQALARCPDAVAVPMAEWPGHAAHAARLAGAEESQHGAVVLPDAEGCGPLYLALLEIRRPVQGSVV